MDDFDVEEFAKREPSSSRTSVCRTCRDYPEHAKKIRRFLEIKADPERGSRMSLKALCDALRAHGYGLSSSAMLNHVRKCEAELYGRIGH